MQFHAIVWDRPDAGHLIVMRTRPDSAPGPTYRHAVARRSIEELRQPPYSRRSSKGGGVVSPFTVLGSLVEGVKAGVLFPLKRLLADFWLEEQGGGRAVVLMRAPRAAGMDSRRGIAALVLPSMCCGRRLLSGWHVPTLPLLPPYASPPSPCLSSLPHCPQLAAGC